MAFLPVSFLKNVFHRRGEKPEGASHPDEDQSGAVPTGRTTTRPAGTLEALSEPARSERASAQVFAQPQPTEVSTSVRRKPEQGGIHSSNQVFKDMLKRSSAHAQKPPALSDAEMHQTYLRTIRNNGQQYFSVETGHPLEIREMPDPEQPGKTRLYKSHEGPKKQVEAPDRAYEPASRRQRPANYRVSDQVFKQLLRQQPMEVPVAPDTATAQATDRPESGAPAASRDYRGTAV